MKSIYTISKTFRFEASHRLVHGYVGNCAHLHGHSWEVSIHVAQKSLNGYGMVRDFADIKVLRKWVDDNLDHATLVSKCDLKLLEFLKQNEQRHFVIPQLDGIMQPNPTSEVLCRFLLNKATELGLYDVYAVEVNETCTSKARYEVLVDV